MTTNIPNTSNSWFGPSFSCLSRKCPCLEFQATLEGTQGSMFQEKSIQQRSTSGITQLVAASNYLEKGTNFSASRPPGPTASPISSISSPPDTSTMQSSPVLPSNLSHFNSEPQLNICQQYSGEDVGASIEISSSAHSSTAEINPSLPSQQLKKVRPQKFNKNWKEFLCPVCQRKFTQKGNLKTHMMIHTGEKPFPCPICGKCFTQKGNVDTHMKVHTGEREYRCDSCGKCFTQKGNLNIHWRSIHMREKPFKCLVCGRLFSQKVNVQNHALTHNKADRLPCTLCGRTFAHKGSLKTHMRSHADMLALEQYGQILQAENKNLFQIHSQNSLLFALPVPNDHLQYYGYNQEGCS